MGGRDPAVGGLRELLRARRDEIEQAALARVLALADPDDSPGPEYAEGLRTAVAAAVDFGIEAVGRSEDNPPPIPTALLSQARLAARHCVGLETVMRRYVAGYTLLGDFLIEESANSGALDAASLKRLLRILAALMDRLMAAVSEEYAREERARPGSAEQRRAELIERLLAGHRLDASGISYDFEANHIALVAKEFRAVDAIRDLAGSLDRRLLLVCREQGVTWAWLGGKRSFDRDEIWKIAGDHLAQLPVAFGEPGEGIAGWRFSHRQARAALPIALRRSGPPVRYGDVALLASMLQDDLLATSLRQIYLTPLGRERDGGESLRRTLRAYFACERNSVSAAAALRITRQTVNNRLRTAERRIGRPLSSCASELEAALCLEDLTGC